MDKGNIRVGRDGEVIVETVREKILDWKSVYPGKY